MVQKDQMSKKSPIDSIVIDMILDHFNIQNSLKKPEVLTGKQFDDIVQRAESIWLQEIMISEQGGSA